LLCYFPLCRLSEECTQIFNENGGMEFLIDSQD